MAYRLPGATTMQLCVQQSFTLHKIKIGDLDHASGFVLADFESARTGNIILLTPDFDLSKTTEQNRLSSWLDTLPDTTEKQSIQSKHQERDDYMQRVNYLIDQLQSDAFEKIVFSRLACKKISSAVKISDFFILLEQQYPSAFISVFSLPTTNVWIGATPESLISIDENQAITMAVAGTRKNTGENTRKPWGHKEIEEQEFVSQFIEMQLSELSVNEFLKEGPVTMDAGSISHLKTTFKIPLPSLEGNIGRFIKGLHPTPAVCGLPKADAYRMIQKAESHDRIFYTGFLGPWNLYKHAQLFVNLRCAELSGSQMNLYLGGGLTASSVASDEWEETEHKSQTLLSVAENLLTFAR